MSYLSKKPYSIAILQLQTDSSYKANLKKLVEYIESNLDKNLIIAPEVYLTGFDYDNFDKAIEFYDKAIDTLLPLIERQILVLTLIKRDKNGNSINQATV
ncbi:MAG TPA: carbon-nitrogen hydrolase family protein, partial [Campylobacterales bacterium]|nr:carbon-nitrogen hydrolase family protein [Campylobacterales bacterium]